MNHPVRRAAAFVLDAAVAAGPAVAAGAVVWAASAPGPDPFDRLGAGVGALFLAGAVWAAVFACNEVVAARAGGTAGERVLGYRLVVPGGAAGWTRTAGRAALRAALLLASLSAVGFATDRVGETAAGAAVGACAAAGIVLAACWVGSSGPVTAAERVCGLGVADVGRGAAGDGARGWVQ